MTVNRIFSIKIRKTVSDTAINDFFLVIMKQLKVETKFPSFNGIWEIGTKSTAVSCKRGQSSSPNHDNSHATNKAVHQFEVHKFVVVEGKAAMERRWALLTVYGYLTTFTFLLFVKNEFELQLSATNLYNMT